MYGSLAWVSYPMLNFGQSLLSTDVTIKLRINKEYKNFVGSGENGGKPMYGWSMDDIATKVGSQDQLKEALAMINVVPNPYYAFSEYERTRIETKVKITNLPERCTVSIYTVSGKLVRTFKKDSPVTSLDWDLTNAKAIPVAGGVYLIHVEVPRGIQNGQEVIVPGRGMPKRSGGPSAIGHLYLKVHVDVRDAEQRVLSERADTFASLFDYKREIPTGKHVFGATKSL
jgi:hypothetical protein